MNKIVVMGGSFNPPTIAHLQLMHAAMEATQASEGIFAPATYGYVLKKMKRQRCPQDTLSDSLRMEMLESFAQRDSRLSVTDAQMKNKEGACDFEMLEYIQAQHPNAEIYFLLGSDKLYILPRWKTANDLLAKFRVLVAKRGEDDLEKIKQQREFIAQHWERFTVFEIPEEIASVSSSAFREKLHLLDESAARLVTPEVWEILRLHGKIPWLAITDFHEEPYRFLSNFYEACVEYNGLTYGSNEAAFQAQKCLEREEQIPFTAFSPGESKRFGRQVALRPDWEKVKFTLMEEIVRAKFTQHPELAEQLLATGQKIIIEGNRWGDTCWGVDIRTGEGENRLGKILMKIRGELQQA